MKIIYNGEEILLDLPENPEENLLNFLIKNNIHVDAHCGKSKKCGKCKVVAEKNKIAYSESELAFLSEDEVDRGVILACFHKVKEFDQIYVNQASQKDMNILSTFHMNIAEKSRFQKIFIDGVFPTLEDNHLPVTSLINNKTDIKYEYSLEALRNLSRMDVNAPFYLLVKDGINVISAAINKEELKSYGIAIDIGATTIALLLVDASLKEIVDRSTFMNPQCKFGADVVSRIKYDSDNKDGLMSTLLTEKLHEEILKITERNFIQPEHLKSLAVAGNTAMIYFLLGLDPLKLSLSPFTTTHLSEKIFSYRDVFSHWDFSSEVTILPGVSAYVGADIVSGLYHCDVLEDNQNILFIDIGTNGEIVLKTKSHDIFCASTAAGPAFEGANIKNGVGGIRGAISKVTITGEGINYETIGDQEPVGICGSGIVDIISELLRVEDMDMSGRLEKDIFITDTISVYQKDIREVQLAKSAIASGIEALLNKAELSHEKVDCVLLAGGFGNNIDIDSAMNIGLIPDKFRGKVKSVGNTSLGGCTKYLFSSSGPEKLKEIKNKAKYIELSNNEYFNNLFLNNMFFGEIFNPI